MVDCMFKNLKNFGFGTTSKFYTIAEIGINHGGDIDIAKRLIDSAAKTGVDCVKFQTYITERRVKKESPIFEILKECELPFQAFEALQSHTKSLGMHFSSTAFDSESASFLDEIGIDLYKVASFDVTNHGLLDQVSTYGKPVVMSVGMANIEEVTAAYNTITNHTGDVAILHCISSYPTEKKDANLLAINSLKGQFDCVIGHSDHTSGIAVPLYAASMGAQVFEKHYMIDDNFNCVDKPVSITEEQMSYFISNLKELEKILGNGVVSLTEPQKEAVQFRRVREF